LPEGDLFDAAPAEMRIDPGDDDCRIVLRLKREGAVDTQNKRRGRDGRFRVALGGSGRPLQLNRTRVAGNGVPDDDWPIGNEACLAQASRSESLLDDRRHEFGERLGAAARRLHGLPVTVGIGRMNVNVSGLGAEAKRNALVVRTLRWWDRNRRELPWRAAPGETTDPYRVWLSEVLLQQTTAQAATPYFEAFVAKWPRVEDLAAASGEAVISAFAGLGYYSRARNLHACAKEVARRGGRFPTREAELRALPGVGAYTAAAIAAIAFGRQAAPVDGNIARIVSRLITLEQPIAQARGAIAAAARVLAPSERAGDFAQALMDIGATICRPRNPDCPLCPLSDDCAAFRSGAPESYPRRAQVKARPRRAGAVFFASRADGAFLARRRPPRGLLASTLELPGTPWTSEGPGAASTEAAPVQAPWRRLPVPVEQVFTHFELTLTVYVAAVEGGAPEGCFWVAPDSVGKAGFSSVMRKAIARAVSPRG
jgi:A/G-specific adenine glycosylase